jgi:hypothetical protein
MAKSIEEKLVDSITSSLSDSRFRYHEFSRILSEQGDSTRINFFTLMIGHLNFLDTYNKYRFYPNGEQLEAEFASKVVPVLNQYHNALDRAQSSMLK